MNEKKHKLETEKIKVIKQVESGLNKKFVVLECVICFVALALFLGLTAIASFCKMSESLRLVLIFVGLANLLIYCFIAIYLEVGVGFHVCEKCGHKHKPTYVKTILAPHIGWTRYMKCPKCGKRSWQRKDFD